MGACPRGSREAATNNGWGRTSPYSEIAGPFASFRVAWEQAESQAVQRNISVDLVAVNGLRWMRVATVEVDEEDSPMLLETGREGWEWYLGIKPATTG